MTGVQTCALPIWYYRHSAGFTPAWPGLDKFKGRVIHPQNWPDTLDLTGKRVTVIGSGATAATLIPALVDKCAHVTMLQRTPTYFATGRNGDALADELRRLGIEEAWIHEIMRRKMVRDRAELIERARTIGELMVRELRAIAATTGVIGEIRGRGAMIAAELVRPGTREPDRAAVAALAKHCHDNGVLTLTAGTFGNVLRFLPPLAISDELLLDAFGVLRDGFAAL